MKERKRTQLRHYCTQYMDDYTDYDELAQDIYHFYFLHGPEEYQEILHEILHEIQVYQNDVQKNGAKYHGK